MPNDLKDLPDTQLPRTTRSLPIALIRAREKVMSPIREMLADTGITEQQWRVLRVLAEAGPLDATKLAEGAGLLAPSLTRITRALAERGLIEQKRSAGDRRRQVMEITPAGRQILSDNLPRALDIVAGYKAKLGEDRYEALLDLLQILGED